MHVRIAPPRDPGSHGSGSRRRTTGGRRRLVLAVGLAFGVAGLQLGVKPATAAGDYLLLSRDRLLSLPTQGEAWRFVVQVANSDWSRPELDDQDNKANVQALAAALVYARTGDSAMRARARNAIEAMIPTYDLSLDAGLGPARQIAGWVLTADLIDLDGSLGGEFRDLLRRALTRPIGVHVRWGGSLRACHEDSDNNWGAWCGASRIAAARYLGDAAELDQAQRVHRGFLGDRDAWSHFRGQGESNGILSSAIRTWSCDASAGGYVPTNPDCGDRAGAFPADAARSGPYQQLDAAYQSETTAGIVLGTELLHQAGYTGVWTTRNALARIAWFDYKHGAWNLGGVQHHWPWLINKRLGTSYPTVSAGYGRSLGYTDWLYGSGGGSDDGPDRTPDPTPDPTPDSPPDATPGPTADPTPSPSHRGKGRGHNKPAPTATPAPPAGTTNGGAPIGPVDEPGSDVETDGAKAKSPPDARKGRGARDASIVTQDAESASESAQVVAVAILLGMMALLLLQPRRRRDRS